jgi:hypothetical protein
MTPNVARPLLAVAMAVWLVALLTNVVLTVLAWGADIPGTTSEQTGGFAAMLGFGVAFAAYPIVGAIVVLRYPANRIGWLFVLAGLALVGAALAPQYRFVDPCSLPWTQWVAWVAGLLDPLFFLLLALILVVFPDGRPPSPRWRPLVWVVLAAIAASLLHEALKPGIIRDDLPLDNPVGVERAAGLFPALGLVVNLLFLAGVLGGVIRILWRFRHSRGEVRAQIKWIAYAALGFVAAVVLAIASSALGLSSAVGDVVFGLSFAGVSVAAGLAILRYRLFEIDRIISRTLCYALLTLVIGAAYVGLVLAGQALFSSFAGGSNLEIAASTLVVAALFLPLRSRVQQFVDRRFNRHRYDAQKTLGAFGKRLREEVDLGTLSGDLRTAVDETKQPAHVSVWLRGPA